MSKQEALKRIGNAVIEIGNGIKDYANADDGGPPPPPKPNNPPTGRPMIKYIDLTVGSTLTADQGNLQDADGLGVIKYFWIRNGSTIVNSGNSFTIFDNDLGTNIELEARYTDGAGNEEAVRSVPLAIPPKVIPPPPPGGKSRIGMNISWPVPWDTSTPFDNLLKQTEYKNGASTHWIRERFNINPSGRYVVTSDRASTISLSGQTTGWSREVTFGANGGSQEITIPKGEEFWPTYSPADADVGLYIAGTKDDGRFSKSYVDELRGFRYLRSLAWQNINNIVGVIPYESLGQYVNRVDKWGASHLDFIQLCNEVGAIPWVCVPHIYGDQEQRDLALLYRDVLDPELFPIVIEFSNECWNFSQAFRHQQDHCEAAGKPFGPSDYPDDLSLALVNQVIGHTAIGYGRESERMFRNFESVLGPARIRKVIAWQWGGSWTARVVAHNAPNAQAYAMAPYFASKHSIGGTIDDQIASIRAGMRADVSGNTERTMRNLAMDGKDKLPLLAYECGQHIISGDQDGLNALVDSPQMGELYKEYGDLLFELGYETACFLGYVGRHRKGTAFGHVQNQSAEEFGKPRWQALRHLIATTSTPQAMRQLRDAEVRRWDAYVDPDYDPNECREIRPSASALMMEK